VLCLVFRHLGVSLRCSALPETPQDRAVGMQPVVVGGLGAVVCRKWVFGGVPQVCAVPMDALVLLLAFLLQHLFCAALHGQCNMLPLLSTAVSPHANNEAGLHSCSSPSLPSRLSLASALIRGLCWLPGTAPLSCHGDDFMGGRCRPGPGRVHSVDGRGASCP
jgi:hypothetical protein